MIEKELKKYIKDLIRCPFCNGNRFSAIVKLVSFFSIDIDGEQQATIE